MNEASLRNFPCGTHTCSCCLHDACHTQWPNPGTLRYDSKACASVFFLSPNFPEKVLAVTLATSAWEWVSFCLEPPRKGRLRLLCPPGCALLCAAGSLFSSTTDRPPGKGAAGEPDLVTTLLRTELTSRDFLTAQPRANVKASELLISGIFSLVFWAPVDFR